MRFLSYLFLILTLGSSLYAAKLSGVIKSKGDCAKSPHHVWLSQGGLLIHHTKVSPNSKFFFNVKPGKYKLVVNTKNRCRSSKSFKLKKGKHLNLVLKRKKHRRPSNTDCTECLSQGSIQNSNLIWWHEFGKKEYSNFSDIIKK